MVEGAGQGSDRIFGGDGIDTISGGVGDDTIALSNFLVSDSVEVIAGGAGTNILSGTSNSNTLDFSSTTLIDIDRIHAGNGNDDVTGSAGNDTIVGGAGYDTLRGGDGDDRFVFGLGDGADTVWLDVNDTGVDQFIFSDAAAEDLWFQRSNDHLIVSTIGTNDRVTIKNWFVEGQMEQHIESENATLNSGAVEQLINAMAAFDAPQGAGSVVPQEARDALAPQLTAAWA
ncbi:hypothetical protein KOI40_00470 [Aestuariicella sp. G3-2]|nr:hypothetical protein [Aestuariicella albida]